MDVAIDARLSYYICSLALLLCWTSYTEDAASAYKIDDIVVIPR